MGSRSLVAPVVCGRRGRTKSIAEVQRSRHYKPRTARIVDVRPDGDPVRPTLSGISPGPSPNTGRGRAVTESRPWTGFGRTEIGHVRASNQDALALLNDCGVWLVADGMSGHPA